MDCVRYRNLAPGCVIDRRFDVLHQRPAAVDIQSLQTIANRQDGLAHVVSILQQQFIDGVAARIGSGSLRVAGSAVLGGIHVSFTARKQHGVAALNQLHDFGGSLVERNLQGFRARLFYCRGVLRISPLPVFRVQGVGERNGNACPHQLILF